MNIFKRLRRWLEPTSAYASVHRWEAHTRQCSGCNAVIALSCAFCPTCGKQQEQLQQETEEMSLDAIAQQVRRSAFEHAKRNAVIWQTYQHERPDLQETRVDIPVVRVAEERPFLAYRKQKQEGGSDA